MWGQKKQVKKDFPRAIIFLILGTIQAQGLYFNSNPNNLEPFTWSTFIFQVKVFIHAEEVESW